MIVKIGDLFESKCSTIVNTVNCVGVMGKGIALQFKKQYPEMFMDYVLRCNRGDVKPGLPYVYQNSEGVSVLNFPTKDHWRSPSRLSYVIDGLDWFIENYERYNIESIAFPPLGCGNGGLSWSTVGPIMYQKLSKLPIQVEIYAPFGTSQREISVEFLSGAITEAELDGKVKSTEQAEMIATVLFSYDQLAKEETIISDKDVYDYVLDWKPHWKEKEFEVCDTIHNMAMLTLMNITCSNQLLDTMAV